MSIMIHFLEALSKGDAEECCELLKTSLSVDVG